MAQPCNTAMSSNSKTKQETITLKISEKTTREGNWLLGRGGGGEEEKTWLKKSTVSKHHYSQHMNDTSNELSSIKHLSTPIKTNN